MLKKLISLLIIAGLLWISSNVISPKKTIFAACSLGVLPTESVSMSNVIDKSLDFPNTISISGAPESFRGRFVYFYIGGYFGSSIQINEEGNGQASFIFSELFPSIQNGPAELVISDIAFTGQGSNCLSSSIMIEIIGGETCLELGAPCSPSTTIPFCNPNAICGPNGFVQLPQLSTFRCTYRAGSCLNCEISPDGTETGCAPATTPVCLDICREQQFLTSSMVAGLCPGGQGYVDTAIGCISFEIISQTARFFLAWSLSIGGGVVLLLIGLSAIMFATSSGNPEKVKSARDLFWAAVTGLLFLILSVFILRFVGVDILGLFG